MNPSEQAITKKLLTAHSGNNNNDQKKNMIDHDRRNRFF